MRAACAITESLGWGQPYYLWALECRPAVLSCALESSNDHSTADILNAYIPTTMGWAAQHAVIIPVIPVTI
jgi:hypothetical protein